MLLGRPGRSESKVLRHRSLEPPAEEVFRGLLLLQPGGRPGPAAEDAGQGREGHLPPPHPEQHRGRAPPDAHRLPGEQPPGRWQRGDPQGAPALHGRPGGHGP